MTRPNFELCLLQLEVDVARQIFGIYDKFQCIIRLVE